MRVRRCKDGTGTARVKGKFPSLKLGKSVWYENHVERDYIYLLEFDPNVLSYKERHPQIQYIYNGARHTFTPDFLVIRRDSKQIIEVKPDDQAAKEENYVFYRLLASIYRQEGYEFSVVTDTEIRTQPRLNNIKLLWRYARTPLTLQCLFLCQDLIRRRRPASLREAVEFFECNHISSAKEVVFALMFRGVLAFDFMQAINADSILYSPGVITTVRKAS